MREPSVIRNLYYGLAEDLAKSMNRIQRTKDALNGGREVTNPDEYIPKLNELLDICKDASDKITRLTR